MKSVHTSNYHNTEINIAKIPKHLILKSTFAVCLIGTPLPLSRLSRVAIRQAIGPVNLEYVLSNWPSSVSEYIQSIRNDCCETEVAKKYALVGRTIIRPTNKIDEATTKF